VNNGEWGKEIGETNCKIIIIIIIIIITINKF